MRRRTKFEGIEQETKLLLSFFFTDSKKFKNLRLQGLFMDTD